MSLVLTHIDPDGTATLTLNRPEVHNAMNEELVATLTAELRRVEADPAVRLVVIAATGRSFSAGIDLSKLQRMHHATPEEMLADTVAVSQMLATLDKLAKPTIAKVQGAAFAGGIGLIACCDVAIASAGALFGVTEVRIGLAPLVLNPYLVRRIGMAATRRYTLTGERFDAREAQSMGLVCEVVHAEQLAPTVAKYADLFRRGAPNALATAKAALAELGRAQDGPPPEEMVHRLAVLRQGPEAREGTRAFLEKRSPSWALVPKRAAQPSES